MTQNEPEEFNRLMLLSEEVDSQESDSTWSQLLQSLGGYGNWRDNSEICTNLHSKLSHFSSEHADTAEHMEVCSIPCQEATG
jgi:hypothetical protein